jgi:hypothetical protein
VPTTPPGESTTSSFLVDPATLAVTPLTTAAWRPAVDPTRRSVVYWQGTVSVDPVSGGWRTATGRLVISSWSAFAGTAIAGLRAAAQASPSASGSAAVTSSPDASSSPSDSANASASPSDTSPSPASPSPAGAGPTALPDDIASAAGVDWAVAWDADGTHFAVWIGDPNNPTFGHLDLLGIDGSTGLPSATDRPIQHQAALPGFSLADGNLAWATPPGQDGNGSSLKVFAYTGSNVGLHTGKAQTGTDPVIVVQH